MLPHELSTGAAHCFSKTYFFCSFTGLGGYQVYEIKASQKQNNEANNKYRIHIGGTSVDFPFTDIKIRV